jgi:hypothetical protein
MSNSQQHNIDFSKEGNFFSKNKRFIFFAIAVLAIGLYFAFRTADPHIHQFYATSGVLVPNRDTSFVNPFNPQALKPGSFDGAPVYYMPHVVPGSGVSFYNKFEMVNVPANTFGNTTAQVVTIINSKDPASLVLCAKTGHNHCIPYAVPTLAGVIVESPVPTYKAYYPVIINNHVGSTITYIAGKIGFSNATDAQLFINTFNDGLCHNIAVPDVLPAGVPLLPFPGIDFWLD